jgi:HD-GYP domain-containing protein (c-di-GMP phosphodiesterase class II)
LQRGWNSDVLEHGPGMTAFRQRLMTLSLALVATLAFGLWIQHLMAAQIVSWQSGTPEAHQAAEGPTQQDAPSHNGRGGGELQVEDVLNAFLQSGLLTFVWTAAIQCFVAYLWLARLSNSQEDSLRRSKDQAVKQLKDLVKTRDAVVFGLAKLADSRDPETGKHLERISHYSTRIASELHRHPRFRKRVDSAFVRSIGLSAALHDIGKVGVEDAILRKPGRLTPQERLRMQIHPIVGGECIEQIERRLGRSNFLAMAREIALYHHEWWDGSGYPHGLAGEAIPLAARIVALADVYDALSSRRVYKEPMSHEKCLEIIQQGSGTQFDPEIVEVLLRIESDFRAVAHRLGDHSEDADSPGTTQHETAALGGADVAAAVAFAIGDETQHDPEPVATFS